MYFDISEWLIVLFCSVHLRIYILILANDCFVLLCTLTYIHFVKSTWWRVFLWIFCYNYKCCVLSLVALNGRLQLRNSNKLVVVFSQIFSVCQHVGECFLISSQKEHICTSNVKARSVMKEHSVPANSHEEKNTLLNTLITKQSNVCLSNFINYSYSRFTQLI